ncbi:MAG: hypothetical protein OHK0052_26560 [Anaerolineales bacterium]
MDTIVNAVYEKGRLRLLTPLSLPENTHVRIVVESIEDTPNDHVKKRLQIEQILVDSGLVLPVPTPATLSGLLSESERLSLAQKISAIGPLSDLILEERNLAP